MNPQMQLQMPYDNRRNPGQGFPGPVDRWVGPPDARRRPFPNQFSPIQGPSNERYFIIKSKNLDNVDISVRDGIWATTPRNEDKLNAAFRESERVILIFSVNNSKHFQGYATMTSHIDPSQSTVWLQPDGVQNFRGSMFHVRWDVRLDLHFSATSNLVNPLNDNLPVNRSRDCQELPAEVGRRLCQLFDHSARTLPAQPYPLHSRIMSQPPHELHKRQSRQLYSPSAPLSSGPESKQTVRYFIIKSSNADHVDIAIRDGIWATTPRNEDKLNRAFEECERVVLIFSVNNSGHFQGYATMTSAIDPTHPTIWMPEGGTKASFTGSMFHIKWEVTCDVSFKQTLHLGNPLNNNLPVKRSRDGQEVPAAIGRQLCALFDEAAAAAASSSERRMNATDPNTNPNLSDIVDTADNTGGAPPPYPRHLELPQDTMGFDGYAPQPNFNFSSGNHIPVNTDASNLNGISH